MEIPYPDLDPRIRVFRHDGIVDAFAVLTQRYLILVDTGPRPETMAAELEELELARAGRPLLVFNTHWDWDHVWGNSLFVGPNAPYPAPILGHRLTAEAMRTSEADRLLAAMRAEHPGVYDAVAWCPPTALIDGESLIFAGDLTLRVIPTPGHTADHLSIWIPELRLLLAGDAAELPFASVSETGSLPQIRASLRRLADLDAKIVLYCHAPGITDPMLIRHNLAYFDELQRRVRSGEEWPWEMALPAGVSLDQVPDREVAREAHAANMRAAELSR